MLKTSINLFITLLFCVTATQAQQINDPNAEVRNVGSFTSVSVSSGIDLYLTPGNEETVVVSASDEKYRDRIKTEVKDGHLKIYIEYKSNIQISWNSSKRKMKAYVSFKTLKGISASGGSDVSILNGSVKNSDLDISLSGGSDLTGSIEVNTLKLNQSGGSDCDLRGSADEAKVTISGGSDLDAYGLSMNNCVLSASGGSDAKLNVSTKLNATASGGCDVDVKGKCEIVKSTSGASEVKRRD